MTSGEVEVLTDALEQLAAVKLQEVKPAWYLGMTEGLAEFPLDVALAAIRRARLELTFLPSIPELRAFCGVPSTDERTSRAGQAVRNATKHGSYRTLQFDDPLIHAAIRLMGGWRDLIGQSEAEFDKSMRFQFPRIYKGLLASGARGEDCQPLLGSCDEENWASGFALEAALRIETGLPPLPESVIRGEIPEHKAGAKRLGNSAPTGATTTTITVVRK